MATVATANKPEPRATQSGAIYTGTDRLVALLEAEKAQVSAACLHKLRGLENQFAEYRQFSRQSRRELTTRCNMLNTSNQTMMASLTQVVADRALAREHVLQAQTQLAYVQNEIVKFKGVMKAAGLTWDGSTFKFHAAMPDAGPSNTTTPDPVQSPIAMPSNDLKIQLEEARRAAGEYERKFKIAEKERDDLKRATGVEVALLKDQIFMLQHEVQVWMSNAHSLPPADGTRSTQDTEMVSFQAHPHESTDNVTSSSISSSHNQNPDEEIENQCVNPLDTLFAAAPVGGTAVDNAALPLHEIISVDVLKEAQAPFSQNSENNQLQSSMIMNLSSTGTNDDQMPVKRSPNPLSITDSSSPDYKCFRRDHARDESNQLLTYTAHQSSPRPDSVSGASTVPPAGEQQRHSHPDHDQHTSLNPSTWSTT